MDIYCSPGTKVRFQSSEIGQTRYGNCDEANYYLVTGKDYVVLKTNVYRSFTHVILEEFPDQCFNSTVFE